MNSQSWRLIVAVFVVKDKRKALMKQERLLSLLDEVKLGVEGAQLRTQYWTIFINFQGLF